MPVESKRTIYPPFLNNYNEDTTVKKYKDIVREEQKKTLDDKGKKKNVYFSFSIISQKTKATKEKESYASHDEIAWLIIIGGLANDSIPMFQYLSSEYSKVIPCNQCNE
ncbi:hypothetical protein PJ311_10865 [Bacillus sp. CLL-7-23]|uniref:Uncharacterized protein n=1 Tax=Bacillus changyiensis TaxID=3004103 RepID=A0ABT4X482_9BACI|nr:hypothetical protein [Bacillus changyiensis]MDA7027110.1 hypothetical protein [Bacillus changyiensis]